MRIPAVPSAKFIWPAVLLLAFAFCPQIDAQNQAQPPQCPNTTASSGTTQNGSPSISESAKNVENAAKSLGSIFKKKAAPADSTATAACPSAAPSATPGTPNANAPNTPAAPPQPNSEQPAPAAAATPSQGATAWQPPSDSPAAAAAPAGPLDPAKLPDVVGIHMGAPREDVPGILLKLHAGTQIYPEGPDTVAGLSIGAILPGNSGGDNIHVEFTLPPGNQRVYYIDRRVQYKQPISHDNVLAALRQKYGKEIFDDTNGQDLMYWLFDEQGHPIPPDKNARQQSPYGCIPDEASGKMWFLNLVRSYTSPDGLPPATFCDSVIVLRVAVPPDPTVLIMTTLEDRALLRREVTAAGEAAKAKAHQQQQQQLKDANQAKPNL